MSAIGRNVQGHERHALDFYETPGWCVRAILPRLGQPRSVVDAGAGTGAISRQCAAYWPAADITAIEIDSGRAQAIDLHRVTVQCRDYLAPPAAGDGAMADLVIANPPYALASEFVEAALSRGTIVAMLLRLGWMASRKRAQFHKRHPSDIYVLSRRPSFTGDGRADNSDYAWFVWGPEHTGRWSILDAPAQLDLVGPS